jgi:hypothetical protein
MSKLLLDFRQLAFRLLVLLLAMASGQFAHSKIIRLKKSDGEQRKSLMVRPQSISLSIVVDQAINRSRVCDRFSQVLMGRQAPWGRELGTVTGCFSTGSEPLFFRNLFDWRVYLKQVNQRFFNIEVCRPLVDLSVSEKICTSSLNVAHYGNLGFLEDEKFLLLAAAGLIEQSPFISSPMKGFETLELIDNRLPTELKKSLIARSVFIKFSKSAKKIRFLEPKFDFGRLAYTSFSYKNKDRKDIYQQRISDYIAVNYSDLAKPRESLRLKFSARSNQSRAMQDVPFRSQSQSSLSQRKSVVEPWPSATCEQKTPVQVGVEISDDIFTPQTCDLLKTLMTSKRSPWQLQHAEFKGCGRQSLMSKDRFASLNHWKIAIEKRRSGIKASICRPIDVTSIGQFSCYGNFEIGMNSDGKSESPLVREDFLKLLLAGLFEHAPVVAFAPASLLSPGSADSDLPGDLRRPLTFRPVRLTYVESGRLFLLTDIRSKTLTGCQQRSQGVLWSRLRGERARSREFIDALQRTALDFDRKTAPMGPLKPAAPTVEKKDPSLLSEIISSPFSLSARPLGNPTSNSPMSSKPSAVIEQKLPVVVEPKTPVFAVPPALPESKSSAPVIEEFSHKTKKIPTDSAADRGVVRKTDPPPAVESLPPSGLENPKTRSEMIRPAGKELAVVRKDSQLPRSTTEKNLPIQKNLQIESWTDTSLKIDGLLIQRELRNRLPAYYSLGFESSFLKTSLFDVGVSANYRKSFFAQDYENDLDTESGDDATLNQSILVTGDRTESVLGLYFLSGFSLASERVRVNSKLRLGLASMSSHWDLDPRVYVRAIGQADGSAAFVGASVSLLPGQRMGGFVTDLTADFLQGERLSGATYSLSSGWRFLRVPWFSRLQTFSKLRFDLLLSVYSIALTSANLIDGQRDTVKSLSAGFGTRISFDFDQSIAEATESPNPSNLAKR